MLNGESLSVVCYTKEEVEQVSPSRFEEAIESASGSQVRGGIYSTNYSS